MSALEAADNGNNNEFVVSAGVSALESADNGNDDELLSALEVAEDGNDDDVIVDLNDKRPVSPEDNGNTMIKRREK